jgi:hypothetical protein
MSGQPERSSVHSVHTAGLLQPGHFKSVELNTGRRVYTAALEQVGIPTRKSRLRESQMYVQPL